MKIIIVLLSVLVIIAGHSNATAQREPPPGASDKKLEDRSIKNRSIELERIKRDANKPDTGDRQQPEKMPEAKFREIKEDFEQIQLSQSDIVNAYTKGKEIDFAKISSSADEMNRRGLRLKENLFPAASDQGEDKKNKAGKKEVELPRLPTDIKMLIVEMDNTLAAFTGNAMFTNPQVVNADSSAKAQADLTRLIRLSAALKQEAGKTARKGD